MNAERDWRDHALALLIFGASVVYLAWLPRSLGAGDEAIQLYEAKRLLEGEVMYRDVFEMTTPGYHYVMALLFWLFGTDIDTARLSMAVLHGVLGALVYATCRRFGIRRGFAWPAGIACLAACQSAWPIASQHWLTSLLSVVLLFVCSGRRREDVRWPVWPGIVLGFINGVQQQRGFPLAAGIFLWLVVDHLLQRRYRAGASSAPLVPQLAWLVGGVLLVLAPLGIGMIASSGFGPVWFALVIFPIYHYGGITHCPWGDVTIMTLWQSTFTFPLVLKYLPLIFAVMVPRLLYRWLRRESREEVATLTLLTMFCATSALSISYFPDFIHLAFIAPAFFVSIAESAEWAARRLPAPRWVRWPLAAAAAAGLLAASGWHLYQNRERQRVAYPIAHDTAFGRIDYAKQEEVGLHQQVTALLDAAPSRELYVYPIASDLYLTADAHNPTPYGFFFALGYNGPEQVQHVLRILAERPPLYVVAFEFVFRIDDPIGAYIKQAYDPLTPTPIAEKLIMRRKEI